MKGRKYQYKQLKRNENEIRKDLDNLVRKKENIFCGLQR